MEKASGLPYVSIRTPSEHVLDNNFLRKEKGAMNVRDGNLTKLKPLLQGANFTQGQWPEASDRTSQVVLFFSIQYLFLKKNDA